MEKNEVFEVFWESSKVISKMFLMEISRDLDS